MTDLVYYWLGFTDGYKINEPYNDEACENQKRYRHQVLKDIRNRKKSIEENRRLKVKLSYARIVAGSAFIC